MVFTRWIGLVALSLAVVGLSGCGIVRHALHHHHHPKRHKHVVIVIEKHDHNGRGHHYDHCDD